MNVVILLLCVVMALSHVAIFFVNNRRYRRVWLVLDAILCVRRKEARFERQLTITVDSSQAKEEILELETMLSAIRYEADRLVLQLTVIRAHAAAAGILGTQSTDRNDPQPEKRGGEA